MRHRIAAGIVLTGAFFLNPLWAQVAEADVYRYVDEHGVVHFTNVKTDRRYRLYYKRSGKSGTELIAAYKRIIQQASETFGLDPLLVEAVIKAESDFDHRAVSQRGAQGLMQLMPETAKMMDVEDPMDPTENIFGGVRYLSELFKRFHHEPSLALAAYNAGPEKVETFGGVPPYPETEAFVKKVMHYYRQLKEEELPAEAQTRP